MSNTCDDNAVKFHGNRRRENMAGEVGKSSFSSEIKRRENSISLISRSCVVY